MAFIIPNATDTTSGNKYAVLDQAEPDSIDFEILGNDKTGIISGCSVTPVISGGNTAVSVAGGVVVLNNVVYTVAENTYTNLAAAPTTSGYSRFDLVVARLSGTTMSLVGLYGGESLTNPTHPRSSSRLVSTIGVDVLSYFNPETDIALASIYRAQGLPTLLASHIVDKRRSINTPIAYRSTAYPVSTDGDIGDLYLRTSSLANGESGVHVKRDATNWVQLAATPIDPGVPIGTVITWVSPVAPNGAVWVECNGAPIARNGTYASLYAVLTNSGATFPYGNGNGSTTFNLPDFRGFFMAGLPISGGALGTAAGNLANEIKIELPNVPSHQHSIDHAHSGTAQESGAHKHKASTADVDFATRLKTEPPFAYVAPVDTASPRGVADDFLYLTQPAYGMLLGFSEETSESEKHTHPVEVGITTGLVSGFQGQTPVNPINIQPKTMYVKYYIRYA